MGPVTLDELCARADRAPSLVRPFAATLEAVGLVEQARDAGDEPLLVPTDKGLDALETWVQVRREGLRQLVLGWSPETHAQIGDVMEGLAQDLPGEE